MTAVKDKGQKTWTELLGPRLPGDELDGRCWIRPLEKNRYKVLMTFDNEDIAKECWSYWTAGK